MTATSTSSTPSKSNSTPIHVALLRGINVGGNNKVPMKDLAALFATLGCTDIQTYVQSGNVIFRAPATGPVTTGLASHIAAAIETRFALRIPVILRTQAEMHRILTANPFVNAGIDPALLHVYFLADQPTPAALRSLNPDRSPGDTFVVSGREIYLHLPTGVARTKLTNLYFDKALTTTSTLRNWRTCTTLATLMPTPSPS